MVAWRATPALALLLSRILLWTTPRMTLILAAMRSLQLSVMRLLLRGSSMVSSEYLCYVHYMDPLLLRELHVYSPCERCDSVHTY